MRFGFRSQPRVSVVVPVYNVADYLPHCLESLLAQRHDELEILVVDDGSTDESGAIADRYAAEEDRLRVVHTANHGLGAARNEGLRHATGDYVGFADSDDVVPPTAYDAMVRSLKHSGSDFVTGSIVWWALRDASSLGSSGTVNDYREPPWMHRLHTPARQGVRAAEHPEILGDVFAWNKLFRRSFWDSAGLSWPEGIRYEDQPTTTRAYLAGRFDVLQDVVYHWRIRDDGSSITQQRASVADLTDRLETKRMALASVEGSPDADAIRLYFLDRVLAGDLHRYFLLIPGCSDEWWALLEAGVRELWGDRSLVHSGLPPVHRLTGWLVEQGRREDAATVMTYVAGLAGKPAPRVRTDDGGVRIDVPGIDPATVDAEALAVRDHEGGAR
jgi:glycosyltransferase involved in cell wall biosynthesis